jgi:isopentenyl-diphosphate delta-isomerase
MQPNQEFVILVDDSDVEIGTMEKIEAHRAGLLHRAFSVFVVDTKGQILLQRRASAKYHSGGLWSNSCCGHPRPGERVAEAARRRLREEMGLDCELTHLDRFLYFAQLEGGLVEHELDHVLIGRSDETPRPNPAEVGDWRWARPERIEDDLQATPSTFTAWFPQAFGILLEEAGPASVEK